MKDDYKKLKEFWNNNFLLDEDKKEELLANINDDDWRDLAPSSKLFNYLKQFKDKNNVLDYGAGSGWASIIMAKNEVKHIDSVDVADNSKRIIDLYSEIFKVSDKINAFTINDEWLESVCDNSYDGVFCSNVLDVIPFELAKEIIKQIYRIVKKDGLVIFSFNYYVDPQIMKNRGASVDGSYVYVDGYLRLNLVSDEGWVALFNDYFRIEKIDYFAWPKEEKETRRIFVMRK